MRCNPERKKKVDGQPVTPCSFSYDSVEEMYSFLNELSLSIINQEEPFVMEESQSLLKAFQIDSNEMKQQFLDENI